jgi:arylsulfatase A-like enzyme
MLDLVSTFLLVALATSLMTSLTESIDPEDFTSIKLSGEDTEFITVYEGNVDAGDVYYGGDAEFDTYANLDVVQNAITAAIDAYANASIDQNRLDTTSAEAVEKISAKGYVYPYREITDYDIGNASAYMSLEQVYNTEEGDYESVPNIVFINFDDLGWNHLNLGDMDSTKYSEVFPNVDRLVKQGGITLTNYVTGVWCTPGRTQFLTGKYASLHGKDLIGAQLSISDATIGHEMQSAGYKTGIIGKWGVGSDHPYIIPANKGFDTFFGFHGTTNTKFTHESEEFSDVYTADVTAVDFWDGEVFAGPHSEYDGIWQTFIYNNKTQDFINGAADADDGAPFFLYYASDLPHIPHEVPDELTDRCVEVLTTDDGADTASTCQFMAAVDELIANITCAVDAAGKLDTTLFVLASDNGGSQIDENVPFYGSKQYLEKGGYSAPAAIFGSLVPEQLRGTNYDSIFHVTDWIPTLMHAATNGQWTGSVVGDDLDGVDMWDAVMGADGTTPRKDALVYVDGDGYLCVVVDTGDNILSYTRGATFEDVLSSDNTVKVSGEDRTVCDVDAIEWGESSITIAVAAAAASDLLVGLGAALSPSSWPALLGACTLLAALALLLRSDVRVAATTLRMGQLKLKQRSSGANAADAAAAGGGATAYGSV